MVGVPPFNNSNNQNQFKYVHPEHNQNEPMPGQFTDPYTGHGLHPGVFYNGHGQQLTIPNPMNQPQHLQPIGTPYSFNNRAHLANQNSGPDYPEPRFLPYDHEERLRRDNPHPLSPFANLLEPDIAQMEEYEEDQYDQEQDYADYDDIGPILHFDEFQQLHHQTFNGANQANQAPHPDTLGLTYDDASYPQNLVPTNENYPGYGVYGHQPNDTGTGIPPQSQQDKQQLTVSVDESFEEIIQEQEQMMKLMNVELEAKAQAYQEAKEAWAQKVKAKEDKTKAQEKSDTEWSWSWNKDKGEEENEESEWGGGLASLARWNKGNIEQDYKEAYEYMSIDDLSESETIMDPGCKGTGDGFVDVSLSDDAVRVVGTKAAANLPANRSILRVLCHGMHRRLSFVLPSCIKKQKAEKEYY